MALRISDFGLRIENAIVNPKSEIRNAQSHHLRLHAVALPFPAPTAKPETTDHTQARATDRACPIHHLRLSTSRKNYAAIFSDCC
jgi:hypothetical protein